MRHAVIEYKRSSEEVNSLLIHGHEHTTQAEQPRRRRQRQREVFLYGIDLESVLITRFSDDDDYGGCDVYGPFSPEPATICRVNGGCPFLGSRETWRFAVPPWNVSPDHVLIGQGEMEGE